MSRNMLATIIRLRRVAVDAASSVLSDTLQRQDDAERELIRAERAVHDATVRAADLDKDDDAVEAFATWLPGGRRRVDMARSALERAAAQTVQARSVLDLSRTALRALEALAGAPSHAAVPCGTRPGAR